MRGENIEYFFIVASIIIDWMNEWWKQQLKTIQKAGKEEANERDKGTTKMGVLYVFF